MNNEEALNPVSTFPEAPPEHVTLAERVKAHIAIARLDHSIKNLFVLPGIAVPLSVAPSLINWQTFQRILLGLIATTLVACSNYVINEVLDAPFDRKHPKKRFRPAARGLVNVPAAYVQWIAMMLLGIWIGLYVSVPFTITAAVLWIMGCLYNLRPIRTKDVVYLDVVTESVNNPLRLLLGWFMVTAVIIPPMSLLLAYWALGCYFMALKRFSEIRSIRGEVNPGLYRPSFKRYTERNLLVSVMFYASSSMLFFGAFAIRYHMELLLAFPCIAYLMAVYLNMSFENDSAAQNPEKLYKQRHVMAGVAFTVGWMTFLLFRSFPQLTHLLAPTLP